jgi:hypothetical protein
MAAVQTAPMGRTVLLVAPEKHLSGIAVDGLGGADINNHWFQQFQVRVDPYRTPGDPMNGLIPTIQDEALGTPGAGDDNIQAFCFRLCLTGIPANRLPIEKPKDFDRSRYEIYFRYARAGGRLW